ncbi:MULTISPECIES: ABC transporter ATP-binding protein [Thermococcus]|uniref:Trehalose/maltose ABC transporter, ATPase component n=2 Tax=Thermococcus sibiricus TaxID=172049 RepID=C6A1D4_THESM|nr:MULTISPECIES: ABC transporter ATP-binding protein [Thermococcus]KUK28708.1 MAG: Trehalose/maltose ABC transporter, ATPase component [Thermococcus sp. 40_45]HII67198.1 ABC transporter ATP-binding protein [Thermococcaceae archaeon]ACS89429.1 Trehalose/maltose ABC transporter, ATPase component [Thermococcus sibiricus MM 739]KUK18374.1 MAG: Trehalose/maltose ABC transporter, ATPase component [Thermococcus sibiricus]MBC7095913.1 ABC transporter ATP-binding protein [Thermococcus sp.]
MGEVKLLGVWKKFEDVTAVKDITLEVKDGEFMILLGPSGCGKTTTLRMISGLEEPTKGQIYIGDKLVADPEKGVFVPPKDRDIAMVFQSYALYPHMTVYDNIAFPLKLRKVPKQEIDKRVREVAELLGLSQLLNRKPRELSGGQRQRVALGRAIVRKPQVFLMDEPLSNLDAKLRVKMRAELKKLQRQLSVTTIYVTHDQVEAMTMGDKIAVINQGVLQQVGTPEEVYDKPANTFVAGFIGSPPMNFMDGSVTEDGFVDFGEFRLKLLPDQFEVLKEQGYVGREVIFGIRPEDIYDAMFAQVKVPGENMVKAMVEIVENLGGERIVYLSTEDISFIAKFPPESKVKEGQKIEVVFDMKKIHIFDKNAKKAIF